MKGRGDKIFSTRRLYLTMLAIFVAGACAAAFLVFNHEAEPVFEGRTLSQWLPDLQSNNTEVRRKASEAFRQMGPKAGPFFVEELVRADSVPRTYLIGLLKRFPSLRSRWMSESERHSRSLKVLRAMQPHSKEVIRMLSPHLLDKNTGLRALNALVPFPYGVDKSLPGEMAEPLALGLRCSDVNVRRMTAVEMKNLPLNNLAAITALQVALKDSDRFVRAEAALSLARLSTDASIAVPAYLDLFEQQAVYESLAVHGVSRFESKAAAAVPALIRIASSKDKDSKLRSQAVYALGKIRSDGQRVVPFLGTLLEEDDSVLGKNAAYAIGAFGNEGSNAIPALLKASKSGDEEVRGAAAYVLSNLLRVEKPWNP